jgi:hypothetical protein
MKTYKKNYIGKGTQHEALNLVKVTLKVEELLKYQHEYEGEQYVSFEVAKMQNPDKYGRTHTIYVNTREETPDKDPKPKNKGRNQKKQTAEA